MAKRILVIDGHPDKDTARLAHALANAYVAGARQAGCETRLVRLAELQFPWLQSSADFHIAADAPDIVAAQNDILWAEHVVFIFPLWVGSAPSLVRAFLEQCARGGFLMEADAKGFHPKLKGKSARLIVTMGMPAFFYRLYFRARGVRSVADNLRMCGFKPIRLNFFGAIEAPGAAEAALARVGKIAEDD